MTVELEPGDIVTPVYEVNQINEETGGRDNNDENGNVIKIKKKLRDQIGKTAERILFEFRSHQ